MYNNVNIRNGCYGYDIYDVNGKYKMFDRKGKAIMLDEVCRSIENGDAVWRVSFEYLGQTRHFEFPRCNIADKKFAAKLQGKGADITLKTFHCFVDSMRWQESLVTTEIATYARLGWIKLPENGKMEYKFRCSKLVGGNSAEYTGNLALAPKGTFDGWREMVRAEVLGHPQLETVLLAALSAPIVGLHGINTTTDNPIYHINFRSGRGKSTACNLVASTAGEPFEGMRHEYDKHGILREKASVLGSWGATPKATISAHAGNRGVPVVMNELGKFMGADMTTVVFNLSEGSDIKRLNTQLETLVTEGFNTVFVSCGEMSLIDRCKSKLEGIKNRVMEIAVPMTEDADHARRIERGYQNNSGFAVPMMAKYMIENGGFDMVQEMYSQVLKELTATAPADVSDRFIQKFPVFLVMAARLAKKALDIDFNIDSVVDFCYKCALQGKDDDGDICKSFEEVVEFLEVNRDNFYDISRHDFEPKTVWGRVRHPNHEENGRELLKEFCIYPDVLKKILKDFGYPNPTTELKEWRDKGALDCDANHLTNKAKILAMDEAKRVYVLQVWKNTHVQSKCDVTRDYLIDTYLKVYETNNTYRKENIDDGNANGAGNSQNIEDLVS